MTSGSAHEPSLQHESSFVRGVHVRRLGKCQVRKNTTDSVAPAAMGRRTTSDAMGDAPPTDTYVGMVRANLRTIVGALR